MASKKGFKPPVKKQDSSSKPAQTKDVSRAAKPMSDSQYEEIFDAVVHFQGNRSPVQAESMKIRATEPREGASQPNSQWSQVDSAKIDDAITTENRDSETQSVNVSASKQSGGASFKVPVKKPTDSETSTVHSEATSLPKFKHAKTLREALKVQESNSQFTSSLSQLGSSSLRLTQDAILTQPPKNLRHRERLQWLQDRRGVGLYIQCDVCKKWRWSDIDDPVDVPKKWICRQNPDISYNDCVIPEKPISVYIEEDLIHNDYTAGSVVWAKLFGYPWWPAMVDDCPDTEQYYWLDGYSDIPTHYHVIFFDYESNDITRSWVAARDLVPFKHEPNLDEKFALKPGHKSRIASGKLQASEALKLRIKQRLQRYSFLARWTKEIVTPPDSDSEQLTKTESRRKKQRRDRKATKEDTSADSSDTEVSKDNMDERQSEDEHYQNSARMSKKSKGSERKLNKDKVNKSGQKDSGKKTDWKGKNKASEKNRSKKEMSKTSNDTSNRKSQTLNEHSITYQTSTIVDKHTGTFEGGFSNSESQKLNKNDQSNGAKQNEEVQSECLINTQSKTDTETNRMGESLDEMELSTVEEEVNDESDDTTAHGTSLNAHSSQSSSVSEQSFEEIKNKVAEIVGESISEKKPTELHAEDQELCVDEADKPSTQDLFFSKTVAADDDDETQMQLVVETAGKPDDDAVDNDSEPEDIYSQSSSMESFTLNSQFLLQESTTIVADPANSEQQQLQQYMSQTMGENIFETSSQSIEADAEDVDLKQRLQEHITKSQTSSAGQTTNVAFDKLVAQDVNVTEQPKAKKIPKNKDEIIVKKAAKNKDETKVKKVAKNKDERTIEGTKRKATMNNRESDNSEGEMKNVKKKSRKIAKYDDDDDDSDTETAETQDRKKAKCSGKENKETGKMDKKKKIGRKLNKADFILKRRLSNTDSDEKGTKKIARMNTEQGKMDTGKGKTGSKVGKSDTKIAKSDTKIAKNESKLAKSDSKEAKNDSKVAKSDKIAQIDTKDAKSDTKEAKNDSKVAKSDTKPSKSDTIVGKTDTKDANNDTKVTKSEKKIAENDNVAKSHSKLAKSDTKIGKSNTKEAKNDSKVAKSDTTLSKSDKTAKTDTKDAKSDSKQGKSDIKLGKSDNKLANDTKPTKSDTKHSNTDTKLTKSYTIPAKSDNKLANDTITAKTDTKLTKSDSKLIKTDSKLANDSKLAKTAKSDAKLAKTDTKLAKSDAKLAKNDAKVAKTNTKPAKSDTKLAKSDSKLAKSDTKHPATDTNKPSTSGLNSSAKKSKRTKFFPPTLRKSSHSETSKSEESKQSEPESLPLVQHQEPEHNPDVTSSQSLISSSVAVVPNSEDLLLDVLKRLSQESLPFDMD